MATFYNASNVHLPSDVSGHKYVLLYSDFYDDDRNWYLGQNLIADSVSIFAITVGSSGWISDNW